MKHGTSPTRDPKMFNNKGMKVGVLILTHEVSKQTGKLMSFKIHKVRLNKIERRVEKKERMAAMYEGFVRLTGQMDILRGDNESLRSFRDRCKERWHHCEV